MGDQHAVVLVEEVSIPFTWRRLLRYAGPGIIMSIAYIDPGNLESDLQTGASTGYTLLWLLATTTAMGFLVQMLAARLGVATGRHMAEVCREEYPRPASLLLWIMAEVAIIGSDIQEVIGSAIAVSILSKGSIPLWAGSLLSAAVAFLLLLTERLGVRHLEALLTSMIAVMAVTFGYMFVTAGVPAVEVVKGFTVPQLPMQDIPTAVALFGSLIMPANLYLHSALVQTRGLQNANFLVKREALRYFGIESGLSLLVSLFINLFLVGVFAAGFYEEGKEAPDIGLQNAGVYLGEAFGPVVVYVWAVGLLAAGQSSTIAGTYTGQFVMSGYLDLKVSPWLRILITRSVALVPTMAVVLLMDPASTQLDQMNQGLNLLQSIQLPFALLPLLACTSSTRVMGALVNSTPITIAAWLIAALVIFINATAVFNVAFGWLASLDGNDKSGWRALVGAVIALSTLLYLGFLLYLMAVGPTGFWSMEIRKDGYVPLTSRDEIADSASSGSNMGSNTKLGKRLGRNSRRSAPEGPEPLCNVQQSDQLCLLSGSENGESVAGWGSGAMQEGEVAVGVGEVESGAIPISNGSGRDRVGRGSEMESGLGSMAVSVEEVEHALSEQDNVSLVPLLK